MNRRMMYLFILVVVAFGIPMMVYLLLQRPQLPEVTNSFGQLETEWKPFSPSSNAFSVSMPTIPQHISGTTPVPESSQAIKRDVYVSHVRNGTMFVVSVIQYPPDVDTSNPEVVLDSITQELIKGTAQNTLVQQDRGLFLNCPSAELIVAGPLGYIRSRVIADGHRLFVVSVTDPDMSTMNSFFKRFIDSFSFTRE